MTAPVHDKAPLAGGNGGGADYAGTATDKAGGVKPERVHRKRERGWRKPEGDQ